MNPPASGSVRAGPLLQFEGAAVRLGGRPVLQPLDLQVHEGEVWALLGPNGAGKTTLLRSALGFVPLSSGQVRVQGTPVQTLTHLERARRMGWLPQGDGPATDLSVREFVALGRYPHQGSFASETSGDRRAVDRALEETALEPLAARSVRELSGGERQRALWARTLAQEAPLLLLDEPTSHLDLTHQLLLMEQLHGFAHARPGRGVIVALHDLNLALKFADQALWLTEGRVVAQGPPATTATEERIFQVFGARTEVHRKGRGVVVYPAAIHRPPSEVGRGARRVHVIGGGGAAGELLEALVEAGHAVTAGPLNMLDSDQETCARLHIPSPLEPPFSSISPEGRQEHRHYLAAAEVLVVAPVAVGPGNLASLEDLVPFAADKLCVIVGGVPADGREYAGGRGRACFEALLGVGAESCSGVAELLERLRDLPRSASPNPPTPAGDRGGTPGAPTAVGSEALDTGGEGV